jgi:hypothetical protein
MRIILFELNEVPWRVLDWYCQKNPGSIFAHLTRTARCYKTYTEDKGNLHPWVTWPTLHRGVNNEQHSICHLGQDLSEINQAFPSIWDILVRQRVSVGVMGSLQSYPPPKRIDSFKFFVPDTYALTSETIPSSLTAFQHLNLRLTKENGRNVSQRIKLKDMLSFAGSLPSIGVQPSTLVHIGSQLILEKTDKTKLNRRRALQSALYFDSFMKQLEEHRPHFTTFFTNHVAASMHRFWAATFRDHYSQFNLPDDWVQAYAHEIEWAMCVADEFLGRLVSFCRKNIEYRLLVASSMGQAATKAEIREGYYTIKDFDRFFKCLNIEFNEIKLATAMAPDVSIHFLTERAANRFRAVQGELEQSLGDLDIDIDDRNMLHMKVYIQPSVERDLPEVKIGNITYSLSELGFKFIADQDRVGVTAYHMPEGIFLSWSARDDLSNHVNAREAISVLSIAPSIIRSYGVNPPVYMSSSKNCVTI